SFNNSGSVQVQAGTLEFDTGFTNTNTSAGAVSIFAGATLDLTSGGSSVASGFNVAGALDFTGSIFPLGAGTIVGSGTVNASNNATLSLGSNNVTVQGSLGQSFSTIDGTGKLTVNGSASFSGYVGQTGSGTTDLKSGGTIDSTAYRVGLD